MRDELLGTVGVNLYIFMSCLKQYFFEVSFNVDTEVVLCFQKSLINVVFCFYNRLVQSTVR